MLKGEKQKNKPHNSATVPKSSPIKSDALFKKVMQEEVAAREFLEYYLPKEFKELVDLSKIKIEQESFVDDGLKRKLSDIIYSVATKDNEEAFVYVLIEHQSTVDYWISFRLWKYMLLLLERHKKGKEKLPLVFPLVLYNGTKKYNAPKNLWDLFVDPERAQKLMTGDYKLVDLHAMSDDEIIKKEHLGMMEYFLKHIHQRDMLKLWERFFFHFKEIILIDKENGYLYLKQFLWYTDAKVPSEGTQALTELIKDNLPKEDVGEVMRTIADVYIEEGFYKGREVWMQEGLQEGKAAGLQEGKVEVAINMIKSNLDFKLISSVTGLSIKDLEKLAG